jgi:hypothetical protein
MAPSLLGFLLSGLSLFAQLPRTGLPSSAPRQVQPQENHALRQQPKSGKSIGQAGKQGPAKALKPLPPRERSLIYRPRRDVRNIK